MTVLPCTEDTPVKRFTGYNTTPPLHHGTCFLLARNQLSNLIRDGRKI
jgi:hypothetical protein